MVDLGANRSQKLLNGSSPNFQGWIELFLKLIIWATAHYVI